MSSLRVIKITNRQDDGPVELTKGATLASNYSIIDEVTQQSAIQISSTGVVTATSFSGNGSGITGLTGTPRGVAIGLIYVG